MSSMVIILAGLHAVPPVIGAVMAKKPGVIIGSAVGALAAVALGASAYSIIDLVGVAIGAFIGWVIAGASSKSSK